MITDTTTWKKTFDKMVRRLNADKFRYGNCKRAAAVQGLTDDEYLFEMLAEAEAEAAEEMDILKRRTQTLRLKHEFSEMKFNSGCVH